MKVLTDYVLVVIEMNFYTRDSLVQQSRQDLLSVVHLGSVALYWKAVQ